MGSDLPASVCCACNLLKFCICLDCLVFSQQTNAVRSTLNKVVLAEYDLPGHLSPEAKDLISKLLKKNPEDRITLSGILDHPFMTEQTLPSQNALSCPSRHHYPYKSFEQSVDSGKGTMATISTGIGRSSFSSANGRKKTTTSAEHFSDDRSRNLRQPPSPPVKERVSTCPSTENFNTCSDQHHLRGSEVATSGHQNKTKSSELWLSNLSTSHFSKKKLQEPLVGNGRTNSLQNKFRSYDASKYSSYYASSWTGKCSMQGTNSSGFHSEHTKPYQNREVFQTTDENGHVTCGSSGPTLSSNKNQSGEQTSHHHKRHGSDSVSRDSSEFLPQERKPSPVKPKGDGQEKRERRSKGDSKGKSLGDVTEPLNAERLRPIRQKTRNAVVSILEDCEVCLEFFHLDHGQEIVTEVLRISSNGMKILVHQPNGKDGQQLRCDPPPVPSSLDGQYLFSNLPSKYWKKYKYAVNFVHLVRKLTPRVTFYSKYAKCVLMENSPHPDFEVCFYNGAKVHQSTKCTKIIEPGGVSYTLESVGGMEGVPLEMRSFVQHVQDAFEKCVKLENMVAQIEQESQNQQFFPLIFGQRPSRKSSSDKTPMQPKPLAISTASSPVLPTSPSIAAPVSVSLLSFNGTIGSTIPNIQHKHVSSRPEANCAKTKSPESKQKRGKEINVTNSYQNYNKQGIASPPAEIFKSTFVEGIGWASQLTSGGVWVQHSDGSQLLVNASEAKVKYTDCEGIVMQYRYSDSFPNVVKAKLSHLPFIIECLAKATRTKT